MEPMDASHKLSAGLKALPDRVSSFASTQAAWRCYANEAITLPKLQEPLTQAAIQGRRQRCDSYTLCIHDWSRLADKHANKVDTYAVTHGQRHRLRLANQLGGERPCRPGSGPGGPALGEQPRLPSKEVANTLSYQRTRQVQYRAMPMAIG
jgi:hypothetical protein